MDTMSYLLGKNSSGSGGGGSTGSDVFIVRASTNDGQHYTIDKTFEEISTAYVEGKPIVYTDEMGSAFLNVSTFEGEVSTFFGSLTAIDSLNVMSVKSITISNAEVNVQFNAYTLTPASN